MKPINLFFVGLLSLAAPAASALEAFACEPEWGALLREVGGGTVHVTTATHAHQDPHHVQARPSLIARLRRADLLVCTGAGLEVGWLPQLLRQSANPRVQSGRPGHFLAADQVPLLEVPTRVDRSMGDVHPQGNPHLHLDPHRLATVAEALGARLAQIDPDRTALYERRTQDFLARWQAAVSRWEARARPLRGTVVVTHHKDFTYLAHWLGMVVAGTLEPKPGIPPSAGHLARLAHTLPAMHPRLILRTPYQPARPSLWLAKRLGIPAVVLPYTVGGSDRAQDLFGLFDDTLDRLLEAR